MYSVGLTQKQPFALLTCLSLITNVFTDHADSILLQVKQLQNLIHTPQNLNASLGFAI
jgi:hypothetical protein